MMTGQEIEGPRAIEEDTKGKKDTHCRAQIETDTGCRNFKPCLCQQPAGSIFRDHYDNVFGVAIHYPEACWDFLSRP